MTFDQVAPVYDALARLVFGSDLLTAQQATWPHIPTGADILIVGGGTGVLLPQLLRTCHPRRVVFLEASAAMLQRARRRVPPGPNLFFQHGTEASLDPAVSFDVILLPFMLDVYPEPVLAGTLLPRLLAVLRHKGTIHITDFDQPRTVSQRLMMKLMLTFFQLVARIPVRRLPRWPDVLRQAGLVEGEIHTFRQGQVRSSCWVRGEITARTASWLPPSYINLQRNT